MTEVSFYHLLTTPLDVALPKLLERVLGLGLRAVVINPSPQRVESLNNALWTYDPASFLPHGSSVDGYPAEQPIWLTHQDENPNGAQVVVVTDGASVGDLGRYVRCLDIFNGGDDEAVAAARARYRAALDLGHSLTYYRQTETGGWEKRGSST
jgi:DNA polymerase-3 subunit chi